jgi:phosphatidylserine/phosphatidylglycerophosphate/cardiolipin synthase-like enzyme
MSNIKPSAQICNAVPGETQEVTLTVSWLPEKAEHPACRAAYAPLICGESTFAAIAQAIENATKSIDIITWGFQASMYFTRGGNGPHKMVGELLEEAANRGVKVRVLVWFSKAAQMMVGASFPGWDYEYAAKDTRPGGKVVETIKSLGEKLDYETPEQYEYDKQWHFRVKTNRIEGLSVRHREMSWLADSEPFGWRLDELPHKISKGTSATRSIALTMGATHHQKMVLVDYEDPDAAVGFIMGHNMLSQYWDTQTHSWQQGHRVAPDQGRDAWTGWQDISSCVYGEVLKHMSENFVEAWEHRNMPGTLKAERAGIQKDVFIPTDERLNAIKNRLSTEKFTVALTKVLGQICRTQPQYKIYDILRAYMESVSRTRKYIYIENQYFRLPDLAKQIQKRAQDLIAAGVDPDKHGYLYLFVVTNSTTDPDVITGGLRTWEMLELLGRGDRMPDYTAIVHNKDPQNKDNQLTPEQVEIKEIPGLKTHICTLVCPDSPQGDRLRTYVHSKVMMIDDIFLIQGSANINLRSMAFDSEIAIALQDTDQGNIVRGMRNHLWNLHTKNGKGCSGDDFDSIYKKWENLLSDNSQIWISPVGGDLKAPIINFIDNSTSLEDKD